CDLCASILHTVVDILAERLVKAAKHYRISDIAIGGGVAANSLLRERIAEEGRKRGWRTFIPERRFTTDNAAMIAVAGYYKYQREEFSTLDAAPVARF
ncbi:MAG: tRNA (adenosine(37)-N6)-threonylcarbamoyltransferase complex transferase subunit TsaD, partial [Alistipes sp.]|nr:tRNA (adenosine(37)-N6)-threonylcarbamoyltransferase complex transferase subunit TsaD [Alistipes sp.]